MLAHRVTRSDMPYFMSDHAGELCLGVEIGHDTARDIDITSGQGEGINVRGIQYRKGKLQVRAMALCRQFLTDSIHILL